MELCRLLSTLIHKVLATCRRLSVMCRGKAARGGKAGHDLTRPVNDTAASDAEASPMTSPVGTDAWAAVLGQEDEITSSVAGILFRDMVASSGAAPGSEYSSGGDSGGGEGGGGGGGGLSSEANAGNTLSDAEKLVTFEKLFFTLDEESSNFIDRKTARLLFSFAMLDKSESDFNHIFSTCKLQGIKLGPLAFRDRC